MNITRLATLRVAARSRPVPPVQLHVSRAALDATQESLRSASAGEREALVLWAGRAVNGQAAVISHLIEPDCIATKDVLVVPHTERVDVSRYLRAQELLVFADLHTHPDIAFLSIADRARPFSVRPGFYAVVVPNFGIGHPLTGWRMYEASHGDWDEVDLGERICIDAI